MSSNAISLLKKRTFLTNVRIAFNVVLEFKPQSQEKPHCQTQKLEIMVTTFRLFVMDGV